MKRWVVEEGMLIGAGARCNAGYKAGVSLSTCLCIHAEENALLEAGRERIRDGSILYCNTLATPGTFAPTVLTLLL